jgi:hypothetical protein
LKRSNQPFWIRIPDDWISNVFGYTDVVFYKGLVVAEGHGDTIVSFKFNNPHPDALNDPNFTYYEKLATTRYCVPAQNYFGYIYFVKSLNGDLWLVILYQIVPKTFSYRGDVYKFWNWTPRMEDLYK